MSRLLMLVSPSDMVNLALRSGAVMLLACVAAALLGRASAARRHLVWSLSVVSLLLLPILSLVLPGWRVAWLPQWAAEPASFTGTRPTALLPTGRSEPRTTTRTADVEPPFTSAPATRTGQPLPAGGMEAIGPPRGAFPWLASVWAAGGLLALVPLAVGLWQLGVLHRRSRVIGDYGWLTLVDELRRQLAVRRRVRLRQSATALAPLTWGALRPVLCVPAEANAWPDQRRRLVLLHELAHVRRWDWLTQLGAHVACALYWFNPLVWLAARQMRIERERACDDLVLASGTRASDYAQELVALAAGLSSSRLSTLVAVPMARRGGLEDRLRGILDRRRSRAALTTAAVCLGAAVAAATISPLAMLRAAPQTTHAAADEVRTDDDPPADNRAAAGPPQRDPTPEELEARASGIRISVLNAKGDRGIPQFRVIAGVSSGSVGSDYERRTGRAVINWQPHTCRIGKEGDYVWPLAEAYEEMALRVEADGYQPQVATGIKKAGGRQHIVFLLAEDQGVAGRVMTPTGKPAAGATVAMALPQKDIVWEAGKLRGADLPPPEAPGDRWRRPLFVQTDAEGAFRLPTEMEPAAVLVIHESGVLEMAYDAWKKSPELTLQPWGSLSGQVLWQDRTGADEEVNLTIHRDEYGYPGMIASYAATRTGQEGKFTFDRVLPGLVQISRPIKSAEPNNAGITSVVLNCMYQHVKVAAGDPTHVVLGGQGRQVVGKFVGLDTWEGATYHFHPEAPHIGFGGDDTIWKAFGQLRESSIGPLLFREQQPIRKDGTFTIEKMLPGRYQLFVSAPGFENYVARTLIQVEPEVPDQKPATLDLGDIATVKKPAEPNPPPVDKPAEKPAESPAAKTVTIRGTVVDDATGEPIGRLITQAGRFDPADPKHVTWGFSEGRSSARDGSFSTTVRWGEGWTARILADGYLPQPVLASAPPTDKDVIEVTIRLKRGPIVRGVVLDHLGQPVRDAGVFAVGPTSLNLAAGQAWSSVGGHDDEARPARTDEQGRFELSTGEAKSLAVSHVTLDAWPAAIPDSGEITIRLPEPARVAVDLDIDGAEQESVVFYQLLTDHAPEFAGVQSSRELKIVNPGKLPVAALPPGKYQLCRSVLHRLGEFGIQVLLDRQFFELKAGETKSIDFVRETGSRIRGQATWPAETKLTGIVISVRSVLDQKSPFDDHEWAITYASHTAAEDGSFQTERILPGTYLLVAEAYTPLTPEQLLRGFVAPSWRAQVKIEVPAEGELIVGDLVLKPSQPAE